MSNVIAAACRSKVSSDKVGAKSLIAAPLLHESRLVGLLIVHQCEGAREWRPSDVQLVTAIADQLAIAITHAHLFAQVRHQAITDGLTNLYNHVYFKNRLKEELKLADRKGTSCSLVMIDLDKLKYINDNFGHPIGDAAIRQVSSILKTILRSGDTAARYGGEEFGVILPETSLLEAALIADRICTQIRNSHVPGLGRITASLGAATYPKQAMSAEELVEKLTARCTNRSIAVAIRQTFTNRKKAKLTCQASNTASDSNLQTLWTLSSSI